MNRQHPSHKRLWIALTFVFVASFAVLGGYGFRIASMAPPIPNKVCTPDGRLLFDGDAIRTGQNVWQSLGLLTGHSYAEPAELTPSETFAPEAESVPVA